MNRKALLYLVGGLVFAWLLWWTYDRNAAGPVRELRKELADAQEEVDDRMASIMDARGAEKALRDIASHALGDTPERAVHGLRVALNTIAHEAGLQEISVDSRDAGAVRSPAERSRSFRDASGRDDPDFHIIEGSLRATTTLDNAMRVLARLQSQDWPKQVVTASISPRDDGKRVELSVSLRTVLLDGFASGGSGIIAEADPRLVARGDLVAQGAIFTAWEPPAVAVVPEKPDPAPDPPKPRKPAWDQWSITGLVDGRDGQELLVINRKSGERKTLRPGDSLLGLVFEGVRDGAAVIRGDEGTFAMLPGQSLASRDHPITDL
ncbi:MAG: hypothetical protein H6812_08510 [Phycisphaeraceae bacterium]|nr:hypothetical protein [Phycisphaerales bacterium]MCB9843286.1 hypothetical protein [Phycisphaeraceae bacterium]